MLRTHSPLALLPLCRVQLFLGTGKYPDESEYESFLNAHGQPQTHTG